MKNFVIAFSGKAGVGKTLSATHLCRKHGFYTTSFASVLKRIAINDFEWNGKKDVKGRRLLQNLGTVGREYDKNVWIANLDRTLFDYPYNLVVIDDCRYKNEADWVVEKGGCVIRIERKNINCMALAASKHASENDLDDYEKFSFVINNNLDKPTLFSNLDDIMKSLRNKYLEDSEISEE